MRLKGKPRVLGKWKEFSSQVTENEIIAVLRQTLSSFLHPDLKGTCDNRIQLESMDQPRFNNLPTNEQSQNALLDPLQL